ncbi:hypothetical protein ACFLZM_05435 [Thermodesulfobacteriota bacterium]
MKIRFLIVLIVLSLPLCSFAEFYRYRDQNGISRYTDDITEVPEDQRPAVNRYESREQGTSAVVNSKVEPKETVKEDATPAAETSEGKKSDAPSGDQAEKKDLIAELQRLMKIETELNKEYDEIEKERQAVKEAKKVFKTRKAVKAYNARISHLNERVEVYGNRQKAYAKEVAAYNKRAKEASQPPQPKDKE